MSAPGNLLVVSAPSGCGKSSLVRALMEVDANVVPSISHTTREPRGQEINGREYFFVEGPVFDQMIANGKFIEWAEVHDHRYGTSHAAIESALAAGHDVVLEIDWQGALQIQRLFVSAILVFVLPPSLQELEKRLCQRGEDTPETIALRLASAHSEMTQVDHFDYVIINEIFERALFDLKSVIHSQRLRYRTQRENRSSTFAALHID